MVFEEDTCHSAIREISVIDTTADWGLSLKSGTNRELCTGTADSKDHDIQLPCMLPRNSLLRKHRKSASSPKTEYACWFGALGIMYVIRTLVLAGF